MHVENERCTTKNQETWVYFDLKLEPSTNSLKWQLSKMHREPQVSIYYDSFVDYLQSSVVEINKTTTIHLYAVLYNTTQKIHLVESGVN